MNENMTSELVSSSEVESSTSTLISPYKSCIIQPYDDDDEAVNGREALLNFREILQLFNCAISQEQAWSVLYQLLVELRYMMRESDDDKKKEYLELIKANQDQIDIDVLHFTKEGVILFKFKSNIVVPTSSPLIPDPTIQHHHDEERQLVESRVLKSIAYLIFDALDYGNNYSNEPVLQTSLSDLLILISGHSKEYNNNNNNKTQSEDDEGYEHEEEECDGASSSSSQCGLDKAIEMCINNVSEAGEAAAAADHYRAVCRGLYAQAYELKVFLAKIEDSKNVLHKAGKDTETHYCFELLDKTDWAKLWMQVIHELRNGVKLRKVWCEATTTITSNQQKQLTSSTSSTMDLVVRRHVEYELTPFEILLDQIRARKYHLRKVSLDTSLAPQVKKDARDIILEFIRSRPPLKKSSLRKLNHKARHPQNAQPPTVNLHEQLMNSIRNNTLSLRKTTTTNKWKSELAAAAAATLASTNKDDNSVIREPKRLLKVDKKLLNNLQSSDDEDSDIDYDDLKNLPILPEHDDSESLLMMNISSSSFGSMIRNSKKKKRIRAPDALRSPLTPIWCEDQQQQQQHQSQIETWRALVTEDVLDDDREQKTKSATSNHLVADISRNLASLDIFAGLRRLNTTTRSNTLSTSTATTDETTSERNQEAAANKVSDKLRMVRCRLTNPIYMNSGPGYDSSFGYVSTQELIKKLNENPQCLKLTFDELCHIRNVLTKAELDYLLFDSHLFNDVARGRVCFSCRKTKFNLFNWGYKCQICRQKICKKCLRQAQIQQGGQLAQVPLSKLGPTTNNNSNKVMDRRLYSTSQLINKQPRHTKQVDPDSFSCVSIDKTSDDTSSLNEFNRPPTLLNSPSMANNRPKTMIKIMEICVDCYQIIDGVDVTNTTTSLDDLTFGDDEIKEQQMSKATITRRSNTLTSHDLLKSAHLNNLKQQSAAVNSENATVATPTIIMNSLSEFEIINGVDVEAAGAATAATVVKTSSPPFRKSNKKRLSHHSTPTTATTNMSTVLMMNGHDVSDINTNNEVCSDEEEEEEEEPTSEQLLSSSSSTTSSSKSSCSSDHFIITSNHHPKSIRDGGLTLDLN